MTSPTSEDFKAHALVLLHKTRDRTNLEAMAEGVKFGYGLGIRHATIEVSKASIELREHRERINHPTTPTGGPLPKLQPTQ